MRRDSSRIAQLYRGSVKRVLSTAELFAIGYGDVGSSIYYALGITAFLALGATPIALVIAGFVFLCTSLSYAELSAMYPESGGSASFARHTFNDLVSFIAGWGLLLDYLVTIAISAFSISPYLSIFIPQLKNIPIHLTATVSIIIALFILNFFGVRKSTRTSLVLAVLAIITQLAIIIFGLFTITDLSVLIEHLRLNQAESWSATTSSFIKGTAMAMVAYTGIESISQLGAEAKNPEKSLPRAFFLNIIFLLALYIGLALVAFSALSPESIGTIYRDDPIAGIASALPFGGSFLTQWVGLFAGALLFVAADAGLLGSSRLSFNMGEFYQLPRFFFKLHPKFRTPYIPLAIFASISIVLVLLSQGKLEYLADLYNFGVMIAFFFTNLSLLVSRVRKPDIKRPFKIPFGIPWKGSSLPISAIIGLIASILVWCLVVITKPHARILGLIWMTVGTLAFWYYRKKMGLTTSGSIQIQKIELPELVEKAPKRILVAFQKPTDVETLSFAIDLAEKNKSKLHVVYIMEVPSAVPLDVKLPKREAVANALLDCAEALARDSGYPVHLEIIRGRDFETSILQLVKEHNSDLLVLGWPGKDTAPPKRRSFSTIEHIVTKAHCRILIRYHHVDTSSNR